MQKKNNNNNLLSWSLTDTMDYLQAVTGLDRSLMSCAGVLEMLETL